MQWSASVRQRPRRAEATGLLTDMCGPLLKLCLGEVLVQHIVLLEDPMPDFLIASVPRSARRWRRGQPSDNGARGRRRAGQRIRRQRVQRTSDRDGPDLPSRRVRRCLPFEESQLSRLRLTRTVRNTFKQPMPCEIQLRTWIASVDAVVPVWWESSCLPPQGPGLQYWGFKWRLAAQRIRRNISEASQGSIWGQS